MSGSARRGWGRTSKLAVGLAAAASAVVAATAAVGRLTPIEVVAAFGAAGAIAFVSARNSRPRAVAHVLTSPPAQMGPALIAAPKAADLVDHPSPSAKPAGRASAADAA
jgi:hypothetical protein